MRPDQKFRLAVGSFREDTSNTVQLIQREFFVERRRGERRRQAARLPARTTLCAQLFLCPPTSLHPPPPPAHHNPPFKVDDEQRRFVADPKLCVSHPYPPTKLAFIPDKDGCRPDLLASSGDHLRIWRVGEDGIALDRLLTNVC